MKKILLITFLGLILNGCGTTSSHVEKGSVKIGMSKDDFCVQVNSFRFAEDPCKMTFKEGYNLKARGMYYPQTKMEIMHDLKKEYFFVFENVSVPFNYATLDEGNGSLVQIFKNFDKAKSYASNIKFEIEENIPDKAKKLCKDLSIEIGTEEFADCTLKKILELTQ